MVRDLCKINSDLFFSLQKMGGERSAGKNCYFQYSKKEHYFCIQWVKNSTQNTVIFYIFEDKGEGGAMI